MYSTNRYSAILAILFLTLPLTTARADLHALIVGINDYPNFSAGRQLQGCRNDAFLIRDLLIRGYGYPEDSVEVLLDNQATRAGILEALDRLGARSAPGDTLLFYYSGHGAQLKDTSGDENDDGLDEILCPTDFRFVARGKGENAILDDDLNAFAKRWGSDRIFVAVLDCCHSGTGLRSLFAPRGVRYLTYEDSFSDTRSVGAEPYIEGTRSAVSSPPPSRAGRQNFDLEVHNFRTGDELTGLSGSVLVSAARAHELAGESLPISINGEKKVHGLLTLELYRLLGRRNLTFGKLSQALESPLVSLRGEQHPQVEVSDTLVDLKLFRDAPKLPEAAAALAGDPLDESFRIRPLRVALAQPDELEFNFAPHEGLEPAADDLRRMLQDINAGEGIQRFDIVENLPDAEAIVMLTPASNRKDQGLAAHVFDHRTLRTLQTPELPAPQLESRVIGELQRLNLVRNFLRLTQWVPPTADLQLELSDPGSTQLREGDLLAFRVRSNRPGYLLLFNVNSQGRLLLLYPNHYMAGTTPQQLLAGEELKIPTRAMGFEFFVEPPLGEEFLFAVLSPRPMPFMQEGISQAEPFAQSADGLEWLRELFRLLDQASPPGRWGSQPDPSNLDPEETWGFAALRFTTSED